ncbi:hypothetical protein [Pseudomonas sp. NFX224]|uniref:hypothetical protein n=1 Tax=Pseudomonas sp. NFX224 TaxID=3402862 RepID=UPI003AFA9450
MLTTQKISKPLSRAESATIMSTILDRYRWRREATARRVSAEWAFSSPRPLSLLSIFSLPSILQPERGEVLGHPAFPLRTTQSLANLHHGAYLPQQASTPPNLNLFRRDSFVFLEDFSRDPNHAVFSYLLRVLGMKVKVIPLSIWLPDLPVDEPVSRGLQVLIFSEAQTSRLIGLRICASYGVCAWVTGKFPALAVQQLSLPTGGMGRTRHGIKRYPRTGQTLSPTDQPTSVEAYERSRWHSVVHNRHDKAHRPH